MDKDKFYNEKSIRLTDIFNYSNPYYNINAKNEYYIVRKSDNIILYLGKIEKREFKTEFVRMCWHDGPIYDTSHEIIFENYDRIDDKQLIEKLKKINGDSVKYLIENYSNLYVV